jgi:hypothetical protein
MSSGETSRMGANDADYLAVDDRFDLIATGVYGRQSSIPPSHYGFTAGAGIEKRAKGIGIAPALRYTRWSEGQGYRGSSGSTLYNPNSVELLVGVSF